MVQYGARVRANVTPVSQIGSDSGFFLASPSDRTECTVLVNRQSTERISAEASVEESAGLFGGVFVCVLLLRL